MIWVEEIGERWAPQIVIRLKEQNLQISDNHNLSAFKTNNSTEKACLHFAGDIATPDDSGCGGDVGVDVASGVGGAVHLDTTCIGGRGAAFALDHQVPVKVVGDHVVFGSSFDQELSQTPAGLLILDCR